jgi:hypothetical protein
VRQKIAAFSECDKTPKYEPLFFFFFAALHYQMQYNTSSSSSSSSFALLFKTFMINQLLRSLKNLLTKIPRQDKNNEEG